MRRPTELPAGAPRTDATVNAARILKASERLFARRGVQNVSMADIAAAAGVGKGTVYRRFGDRAGLARAVIGERERRFHAELSRDGPSPVSGAPARERLIAFVTCVAELLDRHRELVQIAEATAPSDDAVYRLYRAHVGPLLREAQPQADAEFLTDALLAMLSARAFLHLRLAQELPLQRIVEGWTDVVRLLLPTGDRTRHLSDETAPGSRHVG
jgi:AcrR family transcriptional regulator